ncbi:hypothetical protein [Streptomyces murinus]|uniref:hypothetical protein n=1 Tax=Streptomyces murinus TaxID=33900 RepID=UPI00211580D2|nr:hypothetical protein [Streptomyces murinus]
MAIEDVVKQLDELIEKAEVIAEKNFYVGAKDEAYAEVLANRLESAVTRLTMKDSIHTTGSAP